MANFTAVKHSVWEILMKMYLVMVTIFSSLHSNSKVLATASLYEIASDIPSHPGPNGLIVSTEILNLHGVMILQMKQKTKFEK